MSPKLLMFLIVLALSLAPRLAHAETAEEMLAGCRLVANASGPDQKVNVPSDPDAYKCWGAFTVVQELTHYFTPSGSHLYVDICSPGSTTRMQMAAIFVAYVDNHPQRRDDNFTMVAFDALKATFPCGTGRDTRKSP
jgi:hypothetical protein